MTESSTLNEPMGAKALVDASPILLVSLGVHLHKLKQD